MEATGVAITEVARDAWRGRLPRRYETDSWDRPFRRRLGTLLRPGQGVLDVGAGAHPTVPIAERPALREYVGLDIAASELAKAPAGSYSDTSVHDLCRPNKALTERFDLILSWFVLEHVPDTEAALTNMAAYLKPGGRMLVQFAGGRSPQALANRVLPQKVSVELLTRLTDRERDSVFPAPYDRCTQTGVASILHEAGIEARVEPLYVGASYVRFSRLASVLYLLVEEACRRMGAGNWASYYLIDGRRPGGPDPGDPERREERPDVRA